MSSKCSCCGNDFEVTAKSETSELCPHCQAALETGEDSRPASEQRLSQRAERRFSVTSLIYLLNIAVFIGMGFPTKIASHYQLIAWGASWGPLSLGAQPWRVITAIFVHNGLGHLLANLFFLWLVGKTTERMIGSAAFAFVYLASGAIGETLTLASFPEALSCGASGALFGVMGALIVALLRKHLAKAVSWPRTRLFLLGGIAVLSIYGEAGDRYVNNLAHLGGLIAGLCLGAVLTHRSSELVRTRKVIFVTTVGMLVIATLWIRAHNGYVVPLGFAAQAVADNRLSDAARYAELVLQKHPNDAEANVVLSDIYIRQEDYSRAEPLLQRATAADPSNRSALYLLGLVYLRTGQVQAALDITTKLIQIGAVGLKERELFADAVKAKGEFDLAGDQYLSLQRYDDAIDAFRAALVRNPNDVRSKRGLVAAYRANGMNSQADALEKTLPPDGRDPVRQPTQM